MSGWPLGVVPTMPGSVGFAMAGLFALGGGLALLSYIKERRARRLVEARLATVENEFSQHCRELDDTSQTAMRELQGSEARYRALFDGVPVAVIEKDYSELGAWIDGLRSQGVKDVLDYLRTHPEQLHVRFKTVKVLSANRTALQRLDLLDAARMDAEGTTEAISSHLLELFQREVVALWEGRASMTCTLDYPKTDGHLGHALLHWSAPCLQDWSKKRLGLLVFTDLTELRQTEEMLRQSEERPRLALQGFNVGIWEYDYATGESHYSERWKKMLGYEIHEVGTRRDDWLGKVHPEDKPAVEAALDSHLMGKSSFYESEHRVRCKDGSHKWVLSRGQLMFDSRGNPSRIVGAHADISERKAVEQALRESEARYRALFENAVEGVCESTPEGLFTRVNPAFARMLGFESPDELTRSGMRAQDFYVKSARRDEFFQELGRGDLLQGFESEVQRKDGGTLWVSENVRAMRSENGTLECLHTFLTDITERRLADEALRASEARYRQLMEHSPLAILELDINPGITWVNDLRALGVKDLDKYLSEHPEELVLQHRRSRLQGLNSAAVGLVRAVSKEEVIGQQTILSDELKPMRKQILNAIWEGKLDADGRTSFRALDGSIVHAAFHWWMPVYEGQPTPSRTQLVLIDLSDVIQAEEALVGERLRSSKLESLSVLAGGIAHDFNNLLTVVLGNLTLAMMDSQVMASAGRWLKESEGGALKARDLTQQLLTFAKGGDPVRKAVSLSDIVRESAVFALHGSTAKSAFMFTPGLWSAVVDKIQIGQVVQNLVINSAQAMPSGGTITVELSNQVLAEREVDGLAAGRYVKLSISDTGTGIPAPILHRIFDPYFTTKAQGSGLGLATVYSIVKKHQGHVDVESQPGVGTSFYIWLPAAQEHELSSNLKEAATGSRFVRVLFMDDEEPIRRLGQALLKGLGHEVCVVADGEAAITEFMQARARGRPYELVMLDLTVPGGMGGLAALEAIRALDPRIKAIVTSGYSSDPVMGNYRKYGFQGVVPKPYRISDLGRAIQASLLEP